MKKLDFIYYLKLLVIFFRIVCLLFTFLIIISPPFQGNSFQILVQLYLFFCTIVFIIFTVSNYIKKHILTFLLIEYFLVLLYSYYSPHNIILEFVWISEILFSITVFYPSILGIFLIFVIGIPGSIFLSYGYNIGTNITFYETSLPFHILAFPFYFTITFLSILLCCYLNISIRKNKYVKSLELFNEHLNKINRSISHRIFNLENDTTTEERKRISKEIHDTAGYVFINLIMMLQAASAIFHKDTKKTETLIIDARNYAERGINEIRHILRNIRDYSRPRISIQNDIYNVGIAFSKATDVKINIDYGNWPSAFSENIDSLFLSFMQESLTNALKHGHANTISVLCWKSDLSYNMSVIDNGIGAILPIKKGIGITALEDVVNRYNGNVTIKSDRSGFIVHVSIPRESV